MSDLQVQVEELSPVVRKLQIRVPAARVDQATDAFYRRLGRQVKLKGFRPGHVPRRVLEKHYGDRVRNDIARELMDSTFREALGTTDLAPVSPPTVEPEELRPGQEFSYTARVEVRPEVELKQYKGLEVQVAEPDVTDEQVQARLDSLRESMATVVPVEDRDTAQLGDLATVSYELSVEGQDKTESRDEATIEIVPGEMLDGQGGKLEGLKVGESRTVTETFGEGASDELKGKQATFQVTLKGLKRRELPALDDELAKDIGGVESLEELRAKTRADLEENAQNEYKAARRQALLDKLVELNPLEVPPALVDDMAEKMAFQVVQGLARRGIDQENLVRLFEALKKDAMGRAAGEVRTFFLLDAVAKAENVEVSREDAQAEIAQIAEREGAPVEQVRSRYAAPEALTSLMGSMRTDRALAIVEQTAQFSSPPPAPAEGGTAS